jgi:hypothetical protein
VSGDDETLPPVSKEKIDAVKKSIPASSSTRPNPEPQEKVVRRSYQSYGRKVEVIYRFGDTSRHRLAESNLLDVVVSSLKPDCN